MRHDITGIPDTDIARAERRRLLLERFEETLRPEADLARQIDFLESTNARIPEAADLAAFAGTLRRRCRSVPGAPADAIDLCGTGGDRSGTFNVSTTSSFVVAGAGIPVAKHGNRSVSSRCGSADCLGELGITTETEPEEAGRLLNDVGIAFLFAPHFHPAIAHVMEARRTLSERGERSIFNVLGPLVNPAGVRRQAIGVFDEELVEPVAEALRFLGAEKAMVVHGAGLDEITLCGTTRFALLSEGRITTGRLDPEALGFERCTPDDLRGGDAAENARTARAILEGRIQGPKRDIVLLNAAAGILVGSRTRRGLAECVVLARRALDSGTAIEKLELLAGARSDVRRTGTDH